MNPNEIRTNSNSGNGWIKPIDLKVKIESPTERMYFMSAGSILIANSTGVGYGGDEMVIKGTSLDGKSTENVLVTAYIRSNNDRDRRIITNS